MGPKNEEINSGRNPENAFKALMPDPLLSPFQKSTLDPETQS